jgi:hypothetical protein
LCDNTMIMAHLLRGKCAISFHSREGAFACSEHGKKKRRCVYLCRWKVRENPEYYTLHRAIFAPFEKATQLFNVNESNLKVAREVIPDEGVPLVLTQHEKRTRRYFYDTDHYRRAREEAAARKIKSMKYEVDFEDSGTERESPAGDGKPQRKTRGKNKYRSLTRLQPVQEDKAYLRQSIKRRRRVE